MYSFAAVLGYYVLGIEVPKTVEEVFRSCFLDFKNPDHYVIYNMLKNAPDLNDTILRQMVMQLLKDK